MKGVEFFEWIDPSVMPMKLLLFMGLILFLGRDLMGQDPLCTVFLENKIFALETDSTAAISRES
jgi:hypothetical protein